MPGQQTSSPSRRQAPNSVQVQKCQGGIDWPAGGREILDKARERAADERVMAPPADSRPGT
mgnify:CR=1 FL=1